MSRIRLFWQDLKAGPVGRTVKVGYARRTPIILGGSAIFFTLSWLNAKRQTYRRDYIHNKSYLLWRIHDGSIVEQKSPTGALNYLLSRSDMSDEPPRVLTLFEALRTLKLIEQDDRISGIIADFTSTGIPSTPSYTLGLAQIEELHDAIMAVKLTKQRTALESEQGDAALALVKLNKPEPFRTIAVTDTFNSQGDYALATAFDDIYVQPMGDVPLVGLSASIPFWSRALKWLGINVHAEARTKWKSMVSPYVHEELTEEQRENEVELLNGLNDNLCTLIARGRFPKEEPAEALAKVKALIHKGPFSAVEAKQLGLISDTQYRHDAIHAVVGEQTDSLKQSVARTVSDNKSRLHGFYHYSKTMEKLVEKNNDVLEVGVVYLLGTIGEAGEFGTASVIRGLKEAANDESIHGVVLRIDSGGGGVIDSDSIWAAVEQVKAKGKTVVASFGNAAASGGYLVATHSDMILASPSTITGSIGVASLRPTFTQTFLDRIKVNVQSFFTGSQSQSLFHELEGEQLDRHRAHIDATYDTFKGLVCSGRLMPDSIIEDVAGGRVYTGLKAFILAAPPGLKDIIARRQNFLGGDDNETGDMLAQYSIVIAKALADSNAELKDLVPNAVQMDPDQETSSFAVPTTEPSVEIQADGTAIVSLPKEQVEAMIKHHKTWGRGLVDGLGSIHDAAVTAGEIGLAKAMASLKQDHPEWNEAQLAQEVMPDCQFSLNEQGQLETNMDIVLKPFPQPKTLWETARERARRGDAIDPEMASLWQTTKFALVEMMSQAVRSVIQNEVRHLGLDDLRKQAQSKQSAQYAYSGLGMHVRIG